jgi:hypothetical protein
VWLSRLVDAGLMPGLGIAEAYSAGVSAAIMALRGAQAERQAQIDQERLDALRRGG